MRRLRRVRVLISLVQKEEFLQEMAEKTKNEDINLSA